MLHLTAEIARQMGKKICVLFIDWEAQFSCTINYVQSLREFYADVIEEFYCCAPAYDAKFPFSIPTRMAVLGT